MSTEEKLHSHSQLELKLYLPKDVVLVDERFRRVFAGERGIKLFVYDNVKYYKVPIMSFVRHGGNFRPFNS